MAQSQNYLFGGPRPWAPTDWTSSDDRVRGGSSHSYLTPSKDGKTASFNGTLDITTLGGAGFASQRTTSDRSWDLSGYDGLELEIDTAGSDSKEYTLTLKDEILPKRPDGRERSSLSWEYDFKPREKVIVRWGDLRATYRGKEVRDVQPLKLEDVKRLSFMMRSFFGTQEGEFGLSIVSVRGWKGETYEALDEKRGPIVVETEELEESIYEDAPSSCCVIL